MGSEIESRLLNRGEEDEREGLKVRVYEESKKIWRVALPGIISRVTSFGTIVVTQSFIGHISSVELAGYALVQTLGIRFVNGVLMGMSSATETLCGQAYGAKQCHMMGIFLQRSWLVNLATLTILLPLFFVGEDIFRLLGQDKSIAHSAGHVALWFIPFCYAIVFSLTIQMFLQAQQKNIIIAYLSVLQLFVHIPLSWTFVNVFEWGVNGAMAVSSWLLVIGEFVFIFGGWCPLSWRGFTYAALKDLLPVIKLSLSSGLMICLEMWYLALLVLVAGYMKNAEVAISAFSICLNINGWEFMICLGILGAACVRIANELGKGDAKAVKFSIKVMLSTSILIGLTFFVISTSILFNSVYPVLSGVAIGAGLQSTVAMINIVSYYIIGLPFGAVLAYVVGLRVKGLWIGMLSGVVTLTLILSFMMWRTRWDEEVLKASASGT